ncbi:MAG TPA: hypothetical protein VJ868_05995, partial [Actinomycetota bacterium]|nr:hypothetical protein [Actinomycetota bacterium]
MPRSGRRGPTAVAAALALLILPLTAPPGIALDITDVQRYEGASPAETAVAISQELFPSATDAVLIRDDGAGPAEYGSTVAASVGGPVLISDQGDVPAVTIAELDRLNVTDVHLMGDPSVLDGTVAAELAGAGVTVHRLPGALQAAEAVAGAGTPLETVYLVSDAAPAEQILAGPAAAATGTVALEVAPGALPPPVATFLADHAVARAVMFGQTGEDGQGLADLLEAAGVEPVPLYGRDLAETSVALSETSFRDPTEMVLANDSSISSSLLGAGLGAAASAPLLYVPALPPLPAFSEGALSAHAANLTALSVVGPTTEVDADLVDAAVGAADPIEPLPLEDVEPGMTGTGYTVVRGIDPVAFDVEVIDVIPDGIAVDLDMILVRTSGPVIEEIGGIAAGFSGSPVYVEIGGERKLMGAVAYGRGGCDQRIGGVTPAEDMLEVLDHQNLSAVARSSAGGPVSAEVQSAGGTIELRRLDLPTAVGGLLPQRIRKVQRDLERAGYDLRPFSSGSSGGPVFQPFDPLFPGHSWAGVVASGAFSFSGIGTTTYRDGDRSLAFGHPFFFQGRTSLGLSSARVHHVLGDPSHIFGGFKIASVTAAHGIMQQDRLAAVAGAEGIFPHQADLDYDLLNLDSGKEFSFRTDAVPAELFADIAALSLLGALDRTFDEIGGGTVVLTTTIEGRDQDGAPFSVTRT